MHIYAAHFCGPGAMEAICLDVCSTHMAHGPAKIKFISSFSSQKRMRDAIIKTQLIISQMQSERCNEHVNALLSYHFYRWNSGPGITGNLRFWMCTNSIGRGHSCQSACASCPYRTACDNWDTSRHQFLFPIFYESPADLEWENEMVGVSWKIEENTGSSTSMGWVNG